MVEMKLRISERFEGDNFFHRGGWGYFAVLSALILLDSVIFGLWTGKIIGTLDALAGNIILLSVLFLLMIRICRKRSKTVVWGGGGE